MNIVLNQVRIRGTIESIFDLVTTARYWPQWHPSCIRVGGVTERPYHLGDTIRQVAQVAGKTRDGTWTVVGYERRRQVVLQMHDGRIEVRYTFVPIQGNTRVIRRLTYPTSFAGSGHNLHALEQMMHAESEKGMQQLKELVEEILRREAD